LSSATNKSKIEAIAQISYAVRDIGKTVEAWSRLYGFGPWTYAENGGLDVKGRPWKIKMAFAYIGGVEIELIQCTEGRIFQSRFLDTWGEGVHHIAWQVDDVDEEVKKLVAKGAKLFVHDPGRFAYLDAGGVGGAIFELQQKPR
jgi:methylmalonyl-CoA/ethylmalonyl-CoA epimerase